MCYIDAQYQVMSCVTFRFLVSGCSVLHWKRKLRGGLCYTGESIKKIQPDFIRIGFSLED